MIVSPTTFAFFLLTSSFLVEPTKARIGHRLPFKSANPTDKGVEDATPQRGLIIGGSDATPGEYPFFVHEGDCGGSLIHPDIVLTAAHCAPVFTKGSLVFVGAYRRDSSANGAEKRYVADFALHDDYKERTLQNDVMLVKLSSSSSKSPVKLSWDEDEPSDGDDIVSVGLGRMSNGEQATILQEVTMDFVPFDTCEERYEAINQRPDEDVHFCAGDASAACWSGDSGGPALKMDDNGNKVQVGVVCNGYGTYGSFDGGPTVFTRVSIVRDWIEEALCDLSDVPRANGNKCKDDNNCESGRCEGWLGLGTCEAKLGKGQSCNEDSDCLSGDCSWFWGCQ